MSEILTPGEGWPGERVQGPALPVEAPLVGAVRAFEAAKSKCDVLLFQLQFAPRASSEVFATFEELVRQVNAAGAHYSTYVAIAECKGIA